MRIGFLLALPLLAACGRSPGTLLARLLDAAKTGNVEEVRELLDAGADANGTVPIGWPALGHEGPALRLAAIRGEPAITRLLLDRGADAGRAEALHVAASWGRVEILTLLLSRGADPGRLDARKRSPFLLALLNARMPSAVLLAETRGEGLLTDVVLGRVDAVLEALKKDPAALRAGSPDLPGVPPFHVAARAGRLDLAAALVDLGADIAVKGAGTFWAGPPILHAANDGLLETTSFLLERGVSPRGLPGFTAPLTAAADKGHAAVARALIAKGAPVNGDGPHPPLVAAALGGHLETVAALLDLGADPDKRDVRGRSPLQAAATQGYLEILRLLIQRGAAVDPTLPREVRQLTRPIPHPENRPEILRILDQIVGRP